MNRHYFFIVFGICLFCEYLEASSSNAMVKQERAQIKYVNPKYMRDVSVFTARAKRNQPYLSNMTGTLLAPFDNNVSISIIIQLKTGDDFRLTYKICEAFKMKWILSFVKDSSDVPPKCPLPVGTYHFFNMELPPRNIPMPIPDGDYNIMFCLLLTDNPKEKLMLASVILHYEQNKRRG